MAFRAEDGDLDFEEGMLWLPADVLDEACQSKEDLNRQQHQQYHRFNPSSNSVLQRSRNPAHWASGGPGMQAIFLHSGQRSCGTGFFLPRGGRINYQPSKKPACSPVLIPSRVVQALNLNVHALGSQLTPQRDLSNNLNKGDSRDSVSSKNADEVLDDVSAQFCDYSKARSSSPEIFLPKEWSY